MFKKISVALWEPVEIRCSLVKVIYFFVEGSVALDVESALLVVVYGVVSFCPHCVDHFLDEEEESRHRHFLVKRGWES